MFICDYSNEAELSNKFQHDRVKIDSKSISPFALDESSLSIGRVRAISLSKVKMDFTYICVLVLWKLTWLTLVVKMHHVESWSYKASRMSGCIFGTLVHGKYLFLGEKTPFLS